MMPSEADSSLLAPSTAQVSIQSGSKQSKGQPPSAVWDHCRTARDTETPGQKYCNYCIKEPIYGSNNSSNMRKHIERNYKIQIELTPSRIQITTLQQLKQFYLKAESSGQISEIDTQVFRKQLDQDIINKALISLIVVRNLPFTAVEWPEFHTLYQALNPEAKDVITITHSQVKNKIEKAYDIYKDTVRKKL